ncbi:MAG: response regulator receiver protein [Caulobacter sp.]|nr:response regulator receiver protein [Caulobacter sp.]
MDWSLGRWLRTLAVAGCAGGFLALVGALGTDAVPLGRRLIYWIGLSLAGAVIGSLVARLIVGRLLAGRSPWLLGAALVAVLTPIAAAAVWGIGGAPPLTGRSLAGYLVTSLVVTVAMTALMMLTRPRQAITHAAPAGAAPARFLDRLPPKLRGAELYAVEAEDHYLRLRTSKGQDLILLRLADAVAELEGLEGAQTHRSWWVAKAAVRDAKRGDGRAILTLADGAQAPVSRAYAKALREAGWF